MRSDTDGPCRFNLERRPSHTDKRQRWWWPILGGYWLMPTPARAEVVSLAWIEAQAQSPQGRAAAERAEQAARLAELRADGAVARGRYSPQLSLRADATAAPGGELLLIESEGKRAWVTGARDLGETGAFTPVARYGTSLAVEWMALDFGRRSLDAQAAEAALDSARLADEAASQDRQSRTRLTYLDWLHAHAEAKLAAGRAQRMRQASQRLGELVGVGAETALGRQRADRAAQEAELGSFRAESACTLAEQALVAATGVPLPLGAEPDPALLDLAPLPPTATPEPALKALELREQASNLRVRRAEREIAPTVAVAAEAGLRVQQDQAFPVYRATLSASLPLLDGGTRSARADAERARGAQIAAERKQRSRDLEQDRSSTAMQLERIRQELDLARRMAVTSQGLLEQVRDGYALGTATFDQLLEAEDTQVRAAAEVLRSQVTRVRLLWRCAAVRCQSMATSPPAAEP